MKQKHSLVEKIYASKHIPLENKKEAFAKLAKIDSSDLIVRTERYCQAAVPTLEAKRETMYILLESTEDIPLLQMESLCFGFK